MISLLLGIPKPIRQALVWAVAIACAIGGAVLYGRLDERAKEKARQQQDYIEGTQDDRTEQDRLPTDPDGILEWLRRFSE